MDMSNIESKSISDIIKKWFLNSPANGIRRIGRAKTFIATLFWGYSFWVFTVFMVCFINIVFNHYAIHPTKIHLTVQQHQDPDHFPAITFCNINPLKDDKFSNDRRTSRLPSLSTSTNMSEMEYRKIVSDYMERILADQVTGNRHPLIQWGFQLNDLLITCIFNKQFCNRNLTEIFHPNYGNCYTFDNDKHVQNEKMNDMDLKWFIGDENGEENYRVFLELSLHQEEYNELLERRAGFRIFIHRKQEIPMLSETSLFLGPNKYTKITFLPRVMSFTQNCRTDLTDEMKGIFSTYQVRYTQALCYKLCEDQYVVKRCGCIEPTLAVFYQFFNENLKNANIRICLVTNTCLTPPGYFNASKFCPQCLPECELIQYSVQLSHAYYPNVNAYSTVLQRVRNHFRLGKKDDDDFTSTFNRSSSHYRTRLHDNIVAIEISASPYATEILTESSVYTWVDLISSIGGQASLWIGISLISFVEILELFYLFLERFYSYLFVCKKENK